MLYSLQRRLTTRTARVSNSLRFIKLTEFGVVLFESHALAIVPSICLLFFLKLIQVARFPPILSVPCNAEIVRVLDD